MPTRLPCLSSVLSALQTPRASTFSFFFVEITHLGAESTHTGHTHTPGTFFFVEIPHFGEFRIRGLLVHLPIVKEIFSERGWLKNK
jgi:hypothetical protein